MKLFSFLRRPKSRSIQMKRDLSEIFIIFNVLWFLLELN